MAMGSGYLEPLIPRTQRQAKLASKWSWYSSTLTASSGSFGSCKSFLLTIVRSAAGRVIAEFHIGIRPTQLPERRPPLLCEGSAPAPHHHLRRLTIHWCPGSLLILSLDLVELFFHDAINSGCFLVQVTEFAERLHPGLAVSISLGAQLVRQRLRDQRSKRNPALGRHRLGATKDGIGNF